MDVSGHPRFALAAALACAGLLSACGGDPSRTGIVVEASSDLRVPTELDEVRISATSLAGASLYQRSFPLSGAGGSILPLRVGFEPRGNGTAAFRIEAVGLRGGASVVSRSATLSFLPGKVLLLPLPLLAVCGGVACTQAATTCQANKTCAPDAVDPKGLAPYRRGTDAGGSSPDGRDGGSGAGDAGGLDGGSEVGGPADSAQAEVSATDASPDLSAVDRGGGDTGRDGGAVDAPSVVPSLSDGLVGYWSFDSNATTFRDHSGNGNDISTGTRPLWTASGAYRGALDLTPGGQVGIPGSSSINRITTAISIGVFALIQPAGTVRTMISRYLGTGYWKLGYSDNGALRFTAGAQAIQTPNSPGEAGRWVHLAATYDGATARIYIDGSLIVSGALGAVSLVGGPPQGGGYGPMLGGTFMDVSATTIEEYSGQLDELTLHTRALTAAEVAALARGVFPTRVVD
jgi:hypothetical protein